MSTLADYQADLASIQLAIRKIEERGQSSTYDGDEIERARLQTLYDERNRLRNLIAQIEGAATIGSRSRRIVPRV